MGSQSPPLVPPLNKKSDIIKTGEFREIDKKASEAPEELLFSFPDLINYLTEGLTSDLLKLRSLFIWFGSRELLDVSKYMKEAPDDTPYYYLRRITQLGMSAGESVLLFERLCRLAALPCEVVTGYDKRFISYVVGDDTEVDYSRWILVFVDGSWRIVDLQLAFVCTLALPASDWILVEECGEAVRERSSNEGRIVRRVQHVNETCFLPDPEDFIYFACPKNDPLKQLLPQPWTKDKFIRTPVVTWEYLHSAWHLAEKHEAVVEAPEGKCCITMEQVPEGQCAIRYKLFYSEKRSRKKFTDKLQLDNYVKTVAGNKGQQSVLTRLPQDGVYLLEVLSENKSSLCEMRIESFGKREAAKPFPPIPETGLGINQTAIDAGLVDPSRLSGLLVAREGEKVRFRFRTKKPLNIVARLNHSVLPSQLLDNRVVQEEEDDFITIIVTVPWHANNPEFSLQLDARPKDSDEAPLVNVLNYLLTPDKVLVHSTLGKEKQVQEELEAAIDDDDTHRLESAIREFRAAHVKSNDTYAKACTRLCELHRSAVEKATSDEDKLAAALNDVEQSQVVYMLHRSPWLQQAQKTYRQMRKLSSMKHEVQTLSGKQVSEIQTYHHPPAGIQAALVATYLLLGESMKKLKKWSYVQTLLRSRGQQSIVHRIKDHDVSTVAMDKKSLDKARALLDSCSYPEIRAMSVSAASFYNWTNHESADVKDTIKLTAVMKRARSKAAVDTMTESKSDNATTTQQEQGIQEVVDNESVDPECEDDNDEKITDVHKEE